VPGERSSCVRINMVHGFLKDCADVCGAILLGLVHGLQKYGNASINDPRGEVHTYLTIRIAKCLSHFILFTWIDSERVVLICIGGA
jgi:hypothetical protein